MTEILQDDLSQDSPPHLSAATDYIDHWFTYQNLLNPLTPGIQVAIAIEGKIIFNRAYGFAQRNPPAPMTTDHIFRAASQSKTVTAVAILMLADRGLLKLSDPIGLYLPFIARHFDRRYHKITVEQVLEHAAGLWSDGEDQDFWWGDRPFPSEAEIESFYTRTSLAIDPLSRFKYSNFGYGLLGMVIEKIARQSYDEFVRDNIAAPLGITHWAPDYDIGLGAYVAGHSQVTPNGAQAEISPVLNTQALAASSGLCTNARNLCLFYAALCSDRFALLAPKTRARMLAKKWQIPDDDHGLGYATGLIHEEHNGRMVLGHHGTMLGQMGKTLFSPKDDMCVTILANSFTANVAGWQRGVWHIFDFFENHFHEDSILKKYQGHYFDLLRSIYFVAIGNKLYASNPASLMPFENCRELEHLEGHKFRIIRESGYGNFGQCAFFAPSPQSIDNTISQVHYAGYTLRQADNFEEYLARKHG